MPFFFLKLNTWSGCSYERDLNQFLQILLDRSKWAWLSDTVKEPPTTAPSSVWLDTEVEDEETNKLQLSHSVSEK